MIAVQNVGKRFGKLEVLKAVTFTIEKEGIFAVLGPNGSGKTTLLKIILGMVIQDHGDVEIAKRSTNRQWGYRKDIAYLSQIARFPENLTVQEVIRMIGDIRSTEGRAQELVALFGLEKFMKQKLIELSGGTRQKVNLVLTFMFDVSLYILDEPTAGLDPIALIQLKKLIKSEREKGKIILITTHIMGLVEELAEEIIFLLDGNIHFEGSLEALKKRTGKSNLEEAIAEMLRA